MVMKVTGLVVLLVSVCVLVEASPTSKSNSKVKKFYSLYPKSDANKDGTLTTSEMKGYLMRNISSSATSANSSSMRRFLSNAPAADINKDGVLKKVELIKYLGRL